MPDARPSGPPRAVTDADFPAGAPHEEQLRFMLNWAVLAPSILNSQPWRFRVEGREARLFADRSRQLRHLDPHGREMIISCGAALMNLRLAARHYGHAVETEPFPEGEGSDLLAVLRLGEPRRATKAEERLFQAIPVRRTNRHPFDERALPERLLDALEDAAAEEGARLEAITEATEIETLAEMVAAATREQAEERRFNDEVLAWLRPDTDPRRDGVPDRAQGAWDRISTARASPDRSASRRRRLVAESPALLVLVTEADTPPAWLAAGQALERLLLEAAAEGLFASYLNAPVEVEAFRAELARRCGGGHPQLVLRIGYPVRHEGTPRRPVHDVLAG